MNAPVPMDSGRWSMPHSQPNTYPTPNGPMPPPRVTPMGGPMAPPANAEPAKRLSTGMIVGFIVACAVLLAVGLFFIVSVSARGH